MPEGQRTREQQDGRDWCDQNMWGAGGALSMWRDEDRVTVVFMTEDREGRGEKGGEGGGELGL